MIKYDFSMVFSSEEYRLLDEIRQLTGHRSVSDLVSFIIGVLLPYLKLKHILFMKNETGYRRINWSRKKHIVMTRKNYEELKLAHKNLDSYSIAGLIRLMLDVVFEFFGLFGEGCFIMLKKHLKQIEEKLNKKKIWQNPNIQFPVKLACKVSYNTNFEPVYIQLE